MKLNDIIIEMSPPQMADDTEFSLDNSNINHQYAKELYKKSKKKLVKDFGDEKLYQLGYKYFLIDTVKMRIRYFVQYNVNMFSLLKKPAVQQVKVWRDDIGKNVEGLAKEIFFNKLLPTHGLMITDALQTEDGQRFWFNRIRNAFSMNLHVYYVDLVNSKETIKINSMGELEDIKDKAFGYVKKYQSKRLIITNTEL